MKLYYKSKTFRKSFRSKPNFKMEGKLLENEK